MASTNKTTNLELNNWIGGDRSQREDFNSDNEKIDIWAGEVNSQLNDFANNKQDKIEDTGWIDLTLNEGIIARSGLNPQIRRIGKQVFLRGAILAKCLSTTNNLAMFTIPSGFLPSKLIEFTSISALLYNINSYILYTTGVVYAKIDTATTNDAHYFYLSDCPSWLVD